MFEIISKKSRDNARTPMQWNDSKNGGFTTGTPWLSVNPNYTYINAESQIHDPDSVFSYYKKLIELRKNNKIIVYGSYSLLCPDDEKIYAFLRTLGEEKLLVICNFTSETLALPSDVAEQKDMAKDIMISNYAEPSDTLRPYETVVYTF